MMEDKMWFSYSEIKEVQLKLDHIKLCFEIIKNDGFPHMHNGLELIAKSQQKIKALIGKDNEYRERDTLYHFNEEICAHLDSFADFFKSTPNLEKANSGSISALEQSLKEYNQLTVYLNACEIRGLEVAKTHAVQNALSEYLFSMSLLCDNSDIALKDVVKNEPKETKIISTANLEDITHTMKHLRLTKKIEKSKLPQNSKEEDFNIREAVNKFNHLVEFENESGNLSNLGKEELAQFSKDAPILLNIMIKNITASPIYNHEDSLQRLHETYITPAKKLIIKLEAMARKYASGMDVAQRL